MVFVTVEKQNFRSLFGDYLCNKLEELEHGFNLNYRHISFVEFLRI